MSELKKRILEDDVKEGSKPIGLNGKEEKEEEDRVLTQLKKTQSHVSI